MPDKNIKNILIFVGKKKKLKKLANVCGAALMKRYTQSVIDERLNSMVKTK